MYGIELQGSNPCDSILILMWSCVQHTMMFKLIFMQFSINLSKGNLCTILFQNLYYVISGMSLLYLLGVYYICWLLDSSTFVFVANPMWAWLSARFSLFGSVSTRSVYCSTKHTKSKVRDLFWRLLTLSLWESSSGTIYGPFLWHYSSLTTCNASCQGCFWHLRL